MEVVNNYGAALALTPIQVDTISGGLSSYDSGVNSTNKIYFFSDKSLMDATVLYNILTEAQLLTTFADNYIGSITNFGLSYTYNESKKQRIIRQNPINAIRFDTVNEGTIEWCAIRIKSGDYFIFTDEVGTFHEPLSINVDSLTAVSGVENIVHSIKIDIRDKFVGEL